MEGSMRIAGIVILVAGVVVLVFGLTYTQALTEKVVEGFTGRFTTSTMLCLIGGLAMIIGGGVLTVLGRKE